MFWANSYVQQGGAGVRGSILVSGIWEERTERPNIGGISIGSRNGAPSRKGCLISDQMNSFYYCNNNVVLVPSSLAPTTQVRL